ncbi:MAG: FMN-binding negative transcriptional regulator [Pseudomonadota bacterium]
MFRPEEFAEDCPDILVQAMQDIQFACIVTAGDDGLCATHMPIVLEERDGEIILEGHFARANSHWRLGNSSIPSLAIFQGPQAYVHPGWYPSKKEHGKAVPTWNYIVVHAHGPFEAFQGQQELVRHLEMLSFQNEKSRQDPWSLKDAPERYMQSMMRGIVGFRMRVSRLEGVWKLSQNKDGQDFDGVVAGFQNEGQTDSSAIASAMIEAQTSNKQ